MQKDSILHNLSEKHLKGDIIEKVSNSPFYLWITTMIVLVVVMKVMFLLT
jgi:hypothetical protein